MNEAKTLKRNLLFNTVGNIVYFACQWLVTGFFIKRLSDAATGDYNAGLIATAMIVTNVFLTLASYGMRAYQVSDIKDKYKSGDYVLSRVITVAAAVLLCVIYSLVIGYAGEQFWCIMLFLVYKLIEAVTDVFHGFCQKNERMDIIGISYAVRGVASVAVFCLVFSLTKNVNFTLLLMTLLCLAFSAVYDIALTRRFYLPAERSKNGAWRLLLECLPLAVYVFLNTAAASVPKLALERLMGTETIGVYNLVNSPVLILQVGLAFLFTPFITTFSSRLRDKDTRGFLKISALITLGVFAVGIVGIGGVLLLGRWGLTLLYGAEVASYSGLLVPLVVCTVFTSLTLFYCMLLTVLREMKGLIISTALAIAVSLAVSTALINAYGMYGASYASIISLIAETLALAAFGVIKLKKTERADKSNGTEKQI